MNHDSLLHHIDENSQLCLKLAYLENKYIKRINHKEGKLQKVNLLKLVKSTCLADLVARSVLHRKEIWWGGKL